MRQRILSSFAWVQIPLLALTWAAGYGHGVRIKAQPSPTVNVLVWDEQQPKQKEAYPNFLGNTIAEYLRRNPGLSVKSVRLADPENGLAPEVLDWSHVVVWWGHVRHDEIPKEKGMEIVRRIKAGELALIALHSAHWSTPFVEAMNERTRMNFETDYLSSEDSQVEFEFLPPPDRFRAPKRNSIVTPWVQLRKFPDGIKRASVHLPNCCFPAYRPDGEPSYVRTLLPEHPVASGIPKKFTLPNTEMYDEPFHVPEPDEVIFEERWSTGEWFRSGCVWSLEKGRVFYFRPGHETYKVYFESAPLKIIENAALWLGSSVK